MAKKSTQILTVYVKLTVDAAHIKPKSEAYPDQTTLQACLEQEMKWCNGDGGQEMKWCNGDGGQGDYLDILMGMEGTTVEALKLKLKRSGKPDIVVTRK